MTGDVTSKTLIQGDVSFSGASGGSLIAASLALGIEVSTVLTVYKLICSMCRVSGTLWQLDDALLKVLPNDLRACVRVCVCVYIHVYVCTHIYVYTYTYFYI